VPKADNLTTCSVVMKSGNLNFLEPFGPLQACNGIAAFADLSDARIGVIFNNLEDEGIKLFRNFGNY